MIVTEIHDQAFEANNDMGSIAERWVQANQHYLQAELNFVKYALQCHLAHLRGADIPTGPREKLQRALTEAERSLPAPSRLSTLCTLFDLSPFEQNVLLLCAGIELDSDFSALCTAIAIEMRSLPASVGESDNDQYEGVMQSLPTFSLAREVFPGAHWDAFLPVAPLRYWHLVETGSENVLMMKSLQIDEYILHYLIGASYIDERLSSLFAAPMQDSEDDVVPSQRTLVKNLVTLWSPADRQRRLPRGGAETPPHYPLVQLWGEDTTSMSAIISTACKEAGFQLRSLFLAHILSLSAHDLLHIMRLWERVAALHRIALLLDCSQVEEADIERSQAFSWLTQRLSGPLVVVSRERLAFPAVSRPNITYTVMRPGDDERRAIWRRPSLSTLAQHIDLRAGWQELVLPEAQLQLLHGIVAQVRNRTLVHDTWGFKPAGNGRGLGISAMFAGMSGTGKTLAAEVLAHELQLDLYRIDLSSIVSKYIGETEKNLQRVFDAAEEGGVVLLFDEADALFGKRSDVKDSHDRYANIEVSYLLQRMEAYRGLAILTTNLKSSVDVAFLRRLRFVIQFPFPDATQRAEIWRRMFPPSLPVSGLDVNKLARLNVAGGNIRNIALNAAFLAAEEQQPLHMWHVLSAARIEYAKLEKTLTDSEIEGWV